MMRLISIAVIVLSAACAQDIRVSDRDRGPRTDTGITGDTGTSPDGEITQLDGGDDADSGAGNPDAIADAGMTRACIVDPFMPCMDPDESMRMNNEWSSASQFNDNMTVGCPTGDNLVRIDRTKESLLCPSEPADWYNMTFVGCDTINMYVTIRLHPLTDCDASAWDLELLSEGECGNGRVTCSMDGVDRVIQVTIEPRNVVFGWYFGVLQRAQNLKLQYALSVTIN